MSMVQELVEVEVDFTSVRYEQVVGISALTGRVIAGNTRSVQNLDEFADDSQEQDHEPRVLAGWLAGESQTWRAYMRALLFSIAAEPEARLTYRRVDLCMSLLARLMSAETVYPSATPDGEGGITLEWISGKWLIELDLEANGEYFLLHSGEDGILKTKQRGMIRDLPLRELQRLLASFTQYVVDRNSSWRSLYA